MVSCRSHNPLISQRRENMNHESWIMSGSWVSYWRRCMTSLLILRLSPNKIMSFKSNNERKAGSLNPLVCSVSSSAHMTDLHLSCQSVATLHALPQILNRLPRSPHARLKKASATKSCPFLTFAHGCRRHQVAQVVQGVFFNWSYPKIHKYGKKFKYQNWSSPKIHKYQNWSPPQNTETRTVVFH